MRRSEIVAELVKRGYDAKEKNVVKNSTICEAIEINDGSNLSQCIYTKQLLKDAEKNQWNLDQVVSQLIDQYENGRNNLPFTMEEITNIEWIKEHLQIGLQKSSNELLIKKEIEEFEGIEAYLFVSDPKENEGISFKLHPEHLNMYNVFEAELWEIAYEHLCNDIQIKGMSEIMAELMGTPELKNEDDVMYVITNHLNYRGAASILNQEVLKQFCTKHHVRKVFVLPSSIHECILVPDRGEFELEDLSTMVSQVNSAEVDPVEQLPSKAYVVEF